MLNTVNKDAHSGLGAFFALRLKSSSFDVFTVLTVLGIKL